MCEVTCNVTDLKVQPLNSFSLTFMPAVHVYINECVYAYSKVCVWWGGGLEKKKKKRSMFAYLGVALGPWAAVPY